MPDQETAEVTDLRLATILSTAVDGIITISDHGRILTVNRAAEHLFGYEAAEMIGQNVKMLMPEPYHSAHDGYLAHYRETGERHIIGIGREVMARRKDGSTFPMELAVGEAWQGDRRFFTGIIRDVTQRKAMAAQLYQAQKMEAVGQLTGGIAHDFNNILGIAIGNLDLLAEGLEGDPDRLELVEAAQAALVKGADLTRQLLAFARRQPLQPERVEIEDLMAATIRMLRRTLGEQVEIAYRVVGATWPVAVDVAQLEAAITNLAINARDAMSDGGRLSIVLSNAELDEDYAATTPEVSAGDYVMIEVSDTGHGMAQDVLDHVYEPFFTTKPSGKGTGLGLSMVYGFIKQSGGHIKIYSEVGHGTTVRLYLPRTASERQAGAAPPAEIVRGGSETILVVEDNPEVRRVVVRQLRSLGYAILEAGDARAALEILRGDAAVDLLFTDVVMPHGMGGFDLARDAQALRPGLRVLFTSGFPSATFAAAPEMAGKPLLGKPYRKQDLARTLRSLLDTGRPS